MTLLRFWYAVTWQILVTCFLSTTAPPCHAFSTFVLRSFVAVYRTTVTTSKTLLRVGDAGGDYYGESAGSFMVQEFSTYEELEQIVRLAAMPLPERPDGIVCVVKFTSRNDATAQRTEAEYERMARRHPATLFLRCFVEYENASLLFGQAIVTVLPTFDLFYQGNRVGRIQGPSYNELEELLQRYQFQNSQLDLFSERSAQPWGDRKVRDPNLTPRTTNRFIPGYDWNSDKGFFDAAADKAQADFEKQFGNWLPNTNDD